MKAVRITARGGPEVLRIEEVREPTPGPGELLVQVRASALNRADLLQSLGFYPAPPDVPQDIPGLEYAGEVQATGSRVRRFKPGDRVMGITGGAAFAERLVIHEREAVPLPPGLDFAQAAAVPEAFFTAFDALVLQAGLRSGEHVLIHAVASGVGTAASQLAAALGANVIGTSRSREKLARCATTLGVHHPVEISPPQPRFAEQVKAATGGRGADLVLDLVGGGDYLGETVSACAERARILVVGLLGGRSAEVDLGTLLRKRIHLIGTVLRSRPLEEKIAVAQAFERQVLPLFAAGRLAPVVDSVLPMEDIQQGARRMLDNALLGKVVLRWP